MTSQGHVISLNQLGFRGTGGRRFFLKTNPVINAIALKVSLDRTHKGTGLLPRKVTGAKSQNQMTWGPKTYGNSTGISNAERGKLQCTTKKSEKNEYLDQDYQPCIWYATTVETKLSLT